MLHFFRKIRRNLIGNSEFFKYLKYAIGEIVLVVLGILIALYINNWNIGRIAESDAKNYHERLKEDLLIEELILKERINYYEQVQDHAKKTLYALTNHPDSLGSDFILNAYQASQQWVYTNVRDTYDELISTGSIKLIANENLRKRIGLYYDETDVFIRIWYGKTDYRDLARRYIPFEVQEKIQSTCEIMTEINQLFVGLSLIENCDPNLTEEEIDRTLRLLDRNNMLTNDVFLMAANRHVTDLELKIGLFNRKLNGNQELIKLMDSYSP
jgi:hypothetical protein